MPSTLYSSCLAFSLLALVASSQPAQAWGSFDVKLGKGEQVQVKRGFFGNKNVALKDRLGDQFEDSQGILGNKHQKVQLLGNGVEVNQGVLGNKSISAGTILGDKFETRRSFFGLGPRTTHVDLSGASSLAAQLFAHKPAIRPNGAAETGDMQKPQLFGQGAAQSLPESQPFLPEPAAAPGQEQGSAP